MNQRAWNHKLTDTVRDKSPSSLYVHIPFCTRRCYYCDFTVSVATKSIDSYLDDLGREFQLLANHEVRPLKTVFIGGGTPTLLSTSQLEHLFSLMKLNFIWGEDAEVSVEANPDSVNAEKLSVLRSFGVNRISFGAQTFNDRLLQAIGRTHSEETIHRSVHLAYEAGFNRVSVDLMFGLPEQTLDDVRDSLDKLLSLGVGHASVYWLKVESGTPFAVWQKRGKLVLPGEDLEADMYDLVRESLSQNGLHHYEVSNFARPGEEARHNLVYWHNEPYLAAGVGAHGYVSGVRYENVTHLKGYHDYLTRGERPIAATDCVSALEACEDTMMLGLRLREGVSRQRFEKRHGIDLDEVFGSTVRQLVEQNLLKWHEDYLRLTDAAWPIANVVFEQFVSTHVAD